jgi:hypothetical protein
MNPQLDFIKEKECWVVRADNGKSIEGFRNLGVAGLHFDIYELPNDGVKVFENKERTKEIFQKYHPNVPKKYPNWWGTFNMFCNQIQIGHVILSPTSNGDLMVGVVESDLYFELGNETLPHSLRRKINWMDGVFSKNEFPISLQSLFCNSSCFYVDKSKGEESDEETQINSENLIDTDSEGVVYIMKSNTFSDYYKLGYADKDAELRCSALSTDKKYAIFNLEVLGFVKLLNYKRFEKSVHNHFAPIRLNSENGCNIDSEIFKSASLPQDFKEYIQLHQKQKYYNITEVSLNY